MRRAARALAALLLLLAGPASAQTAPAPEARRPEPVSRINRPAEVHEPPPRAQPPPIAADAARSVQTVVMFGAASLLPVALLMITPFVRINIVLILLRQALGSPQAPGNQVLMALALLLSAIVMRPVAERVYNDAVEPYMNGEAGAAAAWDAGSGPIKEFMVDQIDRNNHHDYLTTLRERAHPESPATAGEDFDLGVVAPAYILSELTTALKIGFMLYLPFLVIDLVVSAVLAAMGLFMLPPTLVSTPAKLIVFVLADGWLLVADMLLAGLSG
ncbi:flagellar type III secretion system pore protein FliP [Paludisphaera sp.]|uniref:flagellar type III secretion system pore protein FliP n=1 Tax=Paludisphaera sp. TaxID=2017432 RepID=UPI00301CD021